MKKILVSLPLFALFMVACSTGNTNEQAAKEALLNDSTKTNNHLLNEFDQSKTIFYSLPSPLETAMLIKRAGASFDQDLLNPLENINKYSTNKKMALNLGVYSADLSYSSLFDQTQISIKYMANSKKLAEQLGIIDAIKEEDIKRLEENMNNREVVLDIISESLMNSHAYLTDNNRPAIAVMVLVGGWMEGLYLATSLTDGNLLEGNKALIDRIVYQKLSLLTVMNLLDIYKENPDVAELITKMDELSVIFEQVQIVNNSKVEALTDTTKKMTTINANSEIIITPEVYKSLVEKVKEIRTNFIAVN